jgi:hypothetical protein
VKGYYLKRCQLFQKAGKTINKISSVAKHFPDPGKQH